MSAGARTGDGASPPAAPRDLPLAEGDWAAAVLGIGLSFGTDGPLVRFELRRYGEDPGGAPRRAWELPVSSVALGGLDPAAERRPDLPLQLADGLREGVAAMALPPGQPLWLDLAEPYGYLGAVSWERRLGGLLDRAVLRLPRVLEAPAEDVDVAEVAILADTGPHASAEAVARQVLDLTQAVLRGSPRPRTRVHVFATPRVRERLRSAHPDRHLDVHEPGGAVNAAGALASWSDWIAGTLGGQSLDIAHFLCGAIPTPTGAALVLPGPAYASGPRPDPPPSVLEPDALCSFLTMLGAWGMGMTPPSGSRGRAGAYVADAVARARPGPVLYHRFDGPADAGFLADAYRLLLAAEPSAAPRLGDGFLYCVPSAVSGFAGLRTDLVGSLVDATVRGTRTFAARVPLDEHLLGTVAHDLPGATGHRSEGVPNWVGAVQRFVETATLDQLRRASADVLLARPGAAPASDGYAASVGDLDAVGRTLADIQEAVARHMSAGARPPDSDAYPPRTTEAG